MNVLLEKNIMISKNFDWTVEKPILPKIENILNGDSELGFTNNLRPLKGKDTFSQLDGVH